MRIRKPWKFAGSITLSLFIVIQMIALPAPEIKNVTYGVTFSKYRAQTLGLDWKKSYRQTLELDFKSVRLPIYWNDIEKNNNRYNFKDLDWQIKHAQENNTSIILAIGQ